MTPTVGARPSFLGIAGPVELGAQRRALRQAVFLLRLRAKFGSGAA